MKNLVKLATALMLSTTLMAPMAQAFMPINPASSVQTLNEERNMVVDVKSIRIQTDGYSLKYVEAGNSKFIDQGNGTWIERGNNGAQFNFTEAGRDERNVYLRDNSRGVNLQIDISAIKVRYSDDNGNNFVLAQISNAFSFIPNNNQGNHNNNNNNGGGGIIGQAASFEIVEYTCNEGIPLLAEYEFYGNDGYVTLTHDGFRMKKMPQVRSGSGNRFSDGRNVLHTKSNFAYVNLGGIEDNCTRIN